MSAHEPEPGSGSDPKAAFDPERHLARLQAGSLLLARNLEDLNFKETLVLICQHSPEGSYGLVLNRFSHMPLSEVFDKYREPGNPKRKIYLGGPVQPEELQVLQVTETPAKGSYEVGEGVFLGGFWDDLKQILSPENRAIRLFLGYSGWGAGQLPNEVRMGAWEVARIDLRKFLLGPEEPWIAGGASFKRHIASL